MNRYSRTYRHQTSSRWLRALLYILLLIVAAATLWSRPAVLAQVRAENWHPAFVLLGPALIALLLGIFALDELLWHKNAEKRRVVAVIPMVFGALLLLILFPSSVQEYRVRQVSEQSATQLLNDLAKSTDARIRALVMLAAQTQELSPETWAQIMERGLSDPDPFVRRAATQSVRHKTGLNVGDDEQGLSDSRAYVRQLQNNPPASEP